MGFEVFGVLGGYEGGGDDGGEGFGGEVAAAIGRSVSEPVYLRRREREYVRLFPLESGQVRFNVAVLAVFAFDIVVDVDGFLGSWRSVS